MKNSTKIILIIAVAVLIAAFGVLLGFSLYNSAENEISSSESTTLSENEEITEISNSELDEILKQQEMYVTETHYYYKKASDFLEHDAMGASVYNNSKENIVSFVVVCCAYDSDGKPIKIVQPGENGEGGYLRTITYDFEKAPGDAKFLEPSATCEDILMYVNPDLQIATVKACVKTYTDEKGIVWENPYYKSFQQNYAGRELKAEE